MAALSCSRHCRHSLPLTFPLYLSVCPLHFICLSLYLSVSLSMFPTISLSVRLSACPSLCLFVCLFVGCLLPTFNLLPSVYLCPPLSISLCASSPLCTFSFYLFAALRSVSFCFALSALLFPNVLNINSNNVENNT